jgi:hypothetical protein
MDIDDEDDDDLEMTMSAIEQFNHRLSQLMDKIVQKQSTNQKQELPMAAMFVNGSGRNEQSL